MLAFVPLGGTHNPPGSRTRMPQRSDRNEVQQKKPGSDGLPAELYKVSLKVISEYLINSYNYAYFSGHLSVSQKSGIIKRIPKKDSEAFHVKNWHPIDLIG